MKRACLGRQVWCPCCRGLGEAASFGELLVPQHSLCHLWESQYGELCILGCLMLSAQCLSRAISTGTQSHFQCPRTLEMSAWDGRRGSNWALIWFLGACWASTYKTGINRRSFLSVKLLDIVFLYSNALKDIQKEQMDSTVHNKFSSSLWRRAPSPCSCAASWNKNSLQTIALWPSAGLMNVPLVFPRQN